MSKKIFLFLTIFCSLFILTSCQKKENNLKDDSQDEEITITDQDLINTLNRQSQILFNIGKIDGGGIGTFISKNNTLKDLNNVDKLTSILIYVSMNSKEILHTPVTVDMYNKYLNNWLGDNVNDTILQDNMTTFYTIDGSVISNLYQSLYASNITEYDNNVVCPKYLYKPDENKYLVITTCGNAGEDYLNTYNYKYTKDNSHAYVYVSIAVTDANGSIYADYEKTKVMPNDNNFILNADNYQDFTKYKITFNYNENTKDYNFSKVEKINE